LTPVGSFDPQNNAFPQEILYPALGITPEQLRSGIIVTKVKKNIFDDTAYGWAPGRPEGGVGVPHVLFQDGVFDKDVASGGFTAFPVSAPLTFGTSWFDEDTYPIGTPLTFDTTTGYIKAAVDGDEVIGEIVPSPGFEGDQPIDYASPALYGHPISTLYQDNRQVVLRTFYPKLFPSLA
jgi:hypothetical protein